MATATSPSPSSVLKFQVGMPERLALQYQEGKLVTSRFPGGGDQLLLSFTDGRRAYVEPWVQDRFRAAGIQAGEPFLMTKIEVTHGNRRSIDYLVQKETGAPAWQPAPVSAPPQRSHEQPYQNPQQPHYPTPPSASAPAPIDVLTASGQMAIDSILATEEYARSRGLTDFVFGADNVQRMWTTIYIGMSQGRGR